MYYEQPVRFQEEDYDGGRGLYLFDCSRSSPAFVFRYLINLMHDERQGGTLPGLSAVQGAATAAGTDGAARPLHLLGGRRGGRSHRRLYRRLLPRRVHRRTGHAGRRLVDGHRADYPQTAERAAQQENRPGRVRLCLLAQGLTQRKPSRQCVWLY